MCVPDVLCCDVIWKIGQKVNWHPCSAAAAADLTLSCCFTNTNMKKKSWTNNDLVTKTNRELKIIFYNITVPQHWNRLPLGLLALSCTGWGRIKTPVWLGSESMMEAEMPSSSSFPSSRVVNKDAEAKEKVLWIDLSSSSPLTLNDQSAICSLLDLTHLQNNTK